MSRAQHRGQVRGCDGMIARSAQFGVPPTTGTGGCDRVTGGRWHLEAWRVTETGLLKNK